MTMQITSFFVEKGGAAKTATSCQFAHWLAAKPTHNRVLFVDLDSQEGRASRLMQWLSTNLSVYDVFKGLLTTAKGRPGITMLDGSRALQTLEKEASEHNAFVGNLKRFLLSVSEEFDYCVIDCPPGADIRVKAALICSDFVVCPVKLAQEHVLGIGPVLAMIEKIREAMNPNLVFLGLLITQFEAKAIQKQWFTTLASRYAKFLIGTKIPNRAAIQEAQQMGKPVSELNKSAAKETAKELAQVFEVLVARMEGHNG